MKLKVLQIYKEAIDANILKPSEKKELRFRSGLSAVIVGSTAPPSHPQLCCCKSTQRVSWEVFLRILKDGEIFVLELVGLTLIISFY